MKNIRFPWWASPSTLLVISLLVVFYAIVFVDMSSTTFGKHRAMSPTLKRLRWEV